MPSLIKYRIAGNSVTLALQCANAAVMLSALKNDVIMRDPEVRTMASMMSRYITVWNVTFQMLYASLALACDVLTLTKRDDLLPKNITKIRDFFFSSIVFPGTLLVFTLFWPIYIYDRSIIYPAYIDKAFYQESSYVIHIAIVPSVLWELAFQPRETPKNHRLYIVVVVLFYLVYNAFIYHTYFERGLWPYPLMGMIYQQQFYHGLFHICVLTLIVSEYFLQWPLKDYFWGIEEKKKK